MRCRGILPESAALRYQLIGMSIIGLTEPIKFLRYRTVNLHDCASLHWPAAGTVFKIDSTKAFFYRSE
jgi:hypothetical protein